MARLRTLLARYEDDLCEFRDVLLSLTVYLPFSSTGGTPGRRPSGLAVWPQMTFDLWPLTFEVSSFLIRPCGVEGGLDFDVLFAQGSCVCLVSSLWEIWLDLRIIFFVSVKFDRVGSDGDGKVNFGPEAF